MTHRMKKQPPPMQKVIKKTLPQDPLEDLSDKLAILISYAQPNENPFCIPENLGALSPLWPQARLRLSLQFKDCQTATAVALTAAAARNVKSAPEGTPPSSDHFAFFQESARILLSVACELWLRGQIATVEDVLLQVAQTFTIRLAEKLTKALS